MDDQDAERSSDPSREYQQNRVSAPPPLCTSGAPQVTPGRNVDDGELTRGALTHRRR
jgi:hypothetical protein